MRFIAISILLALLPFQANAQFQGDVRLTRTGVMTPAASQGVLYGSVTEGGIFRGSGTTSDFALKNSAGTTLISNLAGSAPLGFGDAALGFIKFYFAGNLTSNGGNTFAAVTYTDSGLTGAAGDTSYLVGTNLQNAITTQATPNQSVAIVAQLRVNEPNITNNLSGSGVITNAASVYIANAPTEGVTNDALNIASGTARFGGGAVVTGTIALAPASSQATLYASATSGGIFRGSGTTYDTVMTNSAGTVVVGAGGSNSTRLYHPVLTAAAGTPNSVCINAATKEITENAALTCTVSSARYKDEILPFTGSGLRIVSALRPETFYYLDRLDRPRLGLVAEEIAAVDPRLSEWDSDGRPNSIDFPALMAVLIKAAQEQQAQIADLRREIDSLKAERAFRTVNAPASVH